MNKVTSNYLFFITISFFDCLCILLLFSFFLFRTCRRLIKWFLYLSWRLLVLFQAYPAFMLQVYSVALLGKMCPLLNMERCSLNQINLLRSSTLSSGLSAAPLTILEDFIRPFWPTISDQKATLAAKLTSVIFGLTCFSLAFLVANVKTILEATVAIKGSIAGPILGVFTLGIFFPYASATVSSSLTHTMDFPSFLMWQSISNLKGAGIGLAASVACTFLLSIGAQIAKSHNLLQKLNKPLTTEGCATTANITSLMSHVQTNATLSQINEQLLFR